MPHTIAHRRLCSPATLSAPELRALLATATALKQPARRSSGWQPLHGRHLALLCGDAHPACSSFSDAMAEVGADVALLRAGTWLRDAGDSLPKATHLLGQLYDAIDCCGMAPGLVEAIDGHAGVPVFDGIALAEHPAHLLADLLTMREVGSQPLDRLRVSLRGDARSSPYREAEALLAQAGVAVRRAAQPTAVGVDAEAPDDVTDIVVDITAAPGRGRLAMPGAGAVEQERIDRRLLDNRRAIQQAIVVSALS